MDKSFCDLGFAHPNCSWLNIIRFSVQKLQKLNIELFFELLVAFSGFLLLPSFPFPFRIKAPKLALVLRYDLRFKYTCVQNSARVPYMPKKAVSVHGDPNIIATIRQASVRIGRLTWHDVLADAKLFKAAVEYITTQIQTITQ